MPRYVVTCWPPSPLVAEVEAPDEEAAMQAAQEEWDAGELPWRGTWEVRDAPEWNGAPA